MRSRVARGRPNWWVILAVSLALMALLVVTAGGPPRLAGRRPVPLNAAAEWHPAPCGRSWGPNDDEHSGR